jgi:hypothetical protein
MRTLCSGGKLSAIGIQYKVIGISVVNTCQPQEELLLALYQRVADKIYSIQSSLSQFKQYYKGQF